MKNYKLIIKILFFFFLGYSVNSQTLEGSFESKFKRYQKNESFAGTQSQNWSTIAWKGDRIHKQLLLWSSSNINGLSYTISNLVKGADQINASNIKLRFGQYIKGDPDARSCSAYPTHPSFVEIVDALSDETVTSITATDPLKLWLTIDVPSATSIGVYTGTITVNGGATPLIFNISVNVVDYTLPNVANWDFHLDLWQFPTKVLDHYNSANPSSKITTWSDQHFDLFEPGYRILADMGQKAIAAQIKENALGMPSMIRWIRKTNGNWEYDFTAFDKYVTKLMSWGINKQIDCFSPVGWNEDEIPYWDEATNSMKNLNAAIGSSTYNTRWNHFLTAFKTFLDTKGWFDKTVLYLDEVAHSKLNDVFTMVQNNNSTWKIGIAHTSVLSTSNSTQLYDASGILGTTSTAGRSGKITTFYTSCTQGKPNSYVTPETSLAEMVWMGWHATREGLDGYLRWAFDFWQLNDPFDARDGAHTAGDFAMVYRSSNNSPSKYLLSLRGILLRDGIQDFEKLKIIKVSLQSSSNPHDHNVLNGLNAIIDNFKSSSGAAAETLVIKGQKAIEDIILGTFGYCQVNGGSNNDYYIKSLTTTGGTDNISFSTNQYPSNGYEYHSATKVSAIPNGSFTINLENSSASNCARTKVWIDWNNDEDFEDVGEEVFSGGTQGVCTNNTSYSIPVTVPVNTTLGIKRIRIQVRDASDSEPVSCGINDKTGTTDFNLEVVFDNPYCEPNGGANVDYYVDGLTTSGGVNNNNLDFNGSGFPANGYEYHMDTSVDVVRESTFTINLENSSGSKCARTRIWIDWNNDKDFEDTGELVYDGGTFQSCANTISKTVNVQVPANAVFGKTRMRVRLADAWNDKPEPCGTLNHTGAADFEVNIVDASPPPPTYCAASGTDHTDGSTHYYTSAVTTTGGTTNIAYTSSGYPAGGYVSSSEKVTIKQGASFTLNVSLANIWSLSDAFIDWNYDGDFDDAGEQVATFGTEANGNGNDASPYSQVITVPADAAIATLKMRILNGDGWTYGSPWHDTNSPCGTFLANASFLDLEVEVTDVLSVDDFDTNKSDLKIYPNPTTTRQITVKMPEGYNSKTEIQIINTLGQVVYNKVFQVSGSTKNIVLPDTLKNGLYFLKMKVSNKTYSQKIVLRR